MRPCEFLPVAVSRQKSNNPVDPSHLSPTPGQDTLCLPHSQVAVHWKPLSTESGPDRRKRLIRAKWADLCLLPPAGCPVQRAARPRHLLSYSTALRRAP